MLTNPAFLNSAIAHLEFRNNLQITYQKKKKQKEKTKKTHLKLSGITERERTEMKKMNLKCFTFIFLSFYLHINREMCN